MGIKSGALGYFIGQEIYDRTYDNLDNQGIAEEAKSGGVGLASGYATSLLGKVPSYIINKQTNTVEDFYGSPKATGPIESRLDLKTRAVYKSFKNNTVGDEVAGKITKYYQANGDMNGEFTWKKDYKKYVNDVRSNTYDYKKDKKLDYKTSNITPEEFRLKLLDNESQNALKALNKEKQIIEQDRYINRNNPERVKYLDRELERLDKTKIQAGRTGRYYRSEIMKNEIQNGFLLDKSYSNDRIKAAGYERVGTARYADVGKKFGIPQKSLDVWEDGIGLKNLSREDKRVVLFKNIHQGDRMLFNKINKNAHSLGAQISYSIGTGDIKSEKGLHNRLKETIKRSDMDEFKLGRRQYKELGGTNYGKYLKDGANNPFSKLESNEFRKYNLKMASNLNKTIMSQNPFKAKSLGNFSLPNLGGVTAQYFEGGVNMQGDYFFDAGAINKKGKRTRSARVHSRRIKTDVHDIFWSGKLQNKIPILYDEHYHVHRIDNKGKWLNQSVGGKDVPPYFRYQDRMKPSIGENIEDIKTFGRGGYRNKALATHLRKNPKKFAQEAIELFTSKTAVGKVIKVAGVAMDLASVAYLLMESKDFIAPYIFNMSDEDEDFPTKD